MFNKNSSKLSIKIETEGLNESQIRLIKAINTILPYVLTTDNESDFFDGSAELIRSCASLIKQANFNNINSEETSIPYSEQALEYSVDILQEYINEENVICYDN